MTSSQRTAVIIHRPELQGVSDLLSQISDFFASHHWQSKTLSLGELITCNIAMLPKADVLLVIGGDGTFLAAARRYLRQQCPVVGINAGNLGFLTRVEQSVLGQRLDSIIAGHFRTEPRLVFETSYNADFYALNDVVFKNADAGQMTQIRVFDTSHEQDELVCTYDADGLIIATPSGSTAYNLSAGGPIIVPGSNVFAVTPICPHSLSAKPIVLHRNTQLRVEASQGNKDPLLVVMDGEMVAELKPSESINIAVSKLECPLVAFDTSDEGFYALLKHKLNWAENPRKGAQLASIRYR